VSDPRRSAICDPGVALYHLIRGLVRPREECLVVAVETVLWFPRSGGRVLCVHGSGSFHRRIDKNR
jgi:hypothetical protein